jgi:hypothetical protein
MRCQIAIWQISVLHQPKNRVPDPGLPRILPGFLDDYALEWFKASSYVTWFTP